MSRLSSLVPSSLRGVPLASSYPAAVGLALLALCPFIVLTTAATLLDPLILRDLHANEFATQLAGGMANAAYAFGAVIAADLLQRMPSRYLYLACEAAFVAGSLLVVVADSIVPFTAGRVIQGLATGMLLVAALPPLVTTHGADRLPATAAVVNLGLFGMVTLGPLVGGITATVEAWRALFGLVAALGVVGFVLGLVAFERTEPNPDDDRFDWTALPLALGATVLPFFGAAWLTRSSLTSPAFLIPIAAGLVLVVVLIVGQYHRRGALMPVRPIAHTLPVTGTTAAMVAGAAFTILLELSELLLLKGAKATPLTIGALLAPQIIGVGAATWLFKRVLPTAWLPGLALSGLVSLIAGALVLVTASSEDATRVVPIVGLLLGFGAGAGVAPGLFMAGLSVPSTKLGRTFALIELLRSEAAFLVAPVVLYVAMSADDLTTGLRNAIWMTIGLMVVGGIVAVSLYLSGGARPHRPRLDRWLAGDDSAFHSPPVAATLRAD